MKKKEFLQIRGVTELQIVKSGILVNRVNLKPEYFDL